MKTLINSFLVVSVLFLSYCGTPSEESTEAVAVEATDTTPTYTFVSDHKPVWENAIVQIETLVDSMPADMLSYKPTEELRSFAEQIVHIGASSKVIANLYLKDIPPPSERPEIDADAMSKEELKSFAREQLEATWEIMSSVSDEQLNEQIKSFRGNDFTRREGLMTIHDHLTNHKAKANLYIRMSGNVPPAYGYY